MVGLIFLSVYYPVQRGFYIFFNWALNFLYSASIKSSEACYGIVLSVCLSVANVKAYYSETTQDT